MRDGVCPKCGSREVYTKKHGMMGNYRVLPITIMDSVNFQDFVCTECGYVESYILDQQALNRIAQKWNRADGEKRKNDA
jgi:predicted nucleic-acid-binding Zn-ribbon protein